MFQRGELLLAAFLAVNAQAANDAKPDSQVISQYFTNEVYTSADVYTIPTAVTGRIAFKEEDVVQMGCDYHVTSNEMNSLLSLLTNAKFIQRQEERAPNIHTVIYLRTDSGQQLKLVLSPEYVNAPAKGHMNGIPVAAGVGFGLSLINWKKEKTGKGTEMMCQ
jgi:hypothetical protein